MSRSVTPLPPTASSTAWFTTLIASRCAAIPCARNAGRSRRANARRGYFVLRWGQDLPSFPHTPFSATGALPPLRSGWVSLDEAEHFFHNQAASVATLRQLFAFGPECRSRSLRNQCSPSPESPIRPSRTRDAFWKDFLVRTRARADELGVCLDLESHILQARICRLGNYELPTVVHIRTGLQCVERVDR